MKNFKFLRSNISGWRLIFISFLMLVLMFSSGCFAPSIATILKRNYEAEKNAKSCLFDMNIKITFPEEIVPPSSPFGSVFTMKGSGKTALGVEDFKDYKMQITLALADTVTIEEIIINGKVYMKMFDKWYELPEDMFAEAPMQKNPLEIIMIKEEDFEELKKEDDVLVGDVKCYKISAVPTREFMKKIFTEYFNQAGIADLSMKTEVEKLLSSMSMKYIVFIGKEDYLTRKALISMSFELPEVEGKIIQEIEMVMKEYDIELDIKEPEEVEQFLAPAAATPQS